MLTVMQGFAQFNNIHCVNNFQNQNSTKQKNKFALLGFLQMTMNFLSLMIMKLWLTNSTLFLIKNHVTWCMKFGYKDKRWNKISNLKEPALQHNIIPCNIISTGMRTNGVTDKCLASLVWHDNLIHTSTHSINLGEISISSQGCCIISSKNNDCIFAFTILDFKGYGLKVLRLFLKATSFRNIRGKDMLICMH